jgi:hypothetical protein
MQHGGSLPRQLRQRQRVGPGMRFPKSTAFLAFLRAERHSGHSRPEQRGRSGISPARPWRRGRPRSALRAKGRGGALRCRWPFPAPWRGLGRAIVPCFAFLGLSWALVAAMAAVVRRVAWHRQGARLGRRCHSLNAVTRISTRILGSPRATTPRHVHIGGWSGVRSLNWRAISAVAAVIRPSGSGT